MPRTYFSSSGRTAMSGSMLITSNRTVSEWPAFCNAVVATSP